MTACSEDRAGLAAATEAVLSDGHPRTGAQIRALIATDRANRTFPKALINRHAWALVDLQRFGRLVKQADGRYALRDDAAVESIAPPEHPLPHWARTLVSSANSRNARRFADAETHPFTADDLRALWAECGGVCAVSGLRFTEERIGTGKAQRVFAPSLDRLDPERPYSRDNCRLVSIGVNFAMNRWGLDAFLRIAEATVDTSRGKAE